VVTIYDEAKRRLEKKLDGIRSKLLSCECVSEGAPLLFKKENYEGELDRLERDWRDTSLEGVEQVSLLARPYMKGDAGDEDIINCLTALADA